MQHIVYGPGGFDPSKPNNNIIEQYEVEDVHAPLDATGALATLLAVLEVVPVQDAANAVSQTPEALIAEAEAWAAASQ